MSSINPHTLRHLVYSKSLYIHAKEHSDSANVLDRAVATLNFDNAMEMFIYASLDHLGVRAPREDFNGLLNAFKTKVTEAQMDFDLSLLHEVEIRNMHRARNNVQHHGIVPSIDDVERYKTLTEEVLSDISMKILGLKFEEILLGELIKDELVRTLYKKAEKALFSADYEEALVHAAAAFEQAKKKEQGRIYGSGLMLTLLSEKVDEVATKIIEELEVLKLRLDYKKYQKYRGIFLGTLEPFTLLSSNTLKGILNETRKLTSNATSTWRDMDRRKLREETTFCLNFVVDCILRWEAVPRLGWRE